MNKKKINVGILFGGKSAEHEISLLSAKNVIDAIDKEKYNPVLIGINKQGKWLMGKDSEFLLNAGDPKLIKLNSEGDAVALIPQSEGKISNLSEGGPGEKIDVVFPVMHGTFSEDGTIQGLLKLANIPFVGAGVLGSAVGMDKDIMKRLLRDAGLPIGKFITLNSSEEIPEFTCVKDELGLPIFVKPANMGSSVGINLVKNEEEYKHAVKDAFQYDLKIILEKNIEGREIECAVLGNEDPKASVPGEVITTHDFYSYDAKYIDEDGSYTEIPAKIDKETTKRIQELAVKTFKILSCEGMGRCDFFLKPNGEIIVNEINTIPGFTKISMYPKMWEKSGISYPDLIDNLIQLAIERYKKEKKLKTSFIK